MPTESYPVDWKYCATCKYWTGPRSPRMPFLDRVECNWYDKGKCICKHSGFFNKEMPANTSGGGVFGCWEQQFKK